MNSLQVKLSFEAAGAAWGKNALVSMDTDCAIVHLESNLDQAERLDKLQQAGRKLDGQGLKSLTLIGDNWQLDDCWRFYCGYFNPKQDNQLTVGSQNDQLQGDFLKRQQCIDWVRQQINFGPEVIFPLSLCERAAELISQQAPDKVSYQIIEGLELLQAGWLGTYNVGKGSVQAPAMLVLDYNPTGDESTAIAATLVGKGITFDSGGYSLKPSDGMAIMKSDMGGAATLSGALALAISQGLEQRVQLILCCAENLVSGEAYKLGEIIEYKNGVRVEVLNSDAEGRLVLADGLIKACESNPGLIIDAATLTGSAKMALGRDYHASFSFDDSMIEKLDAHAKANHESFWRLPLANFHRSQINSNFADIANIHSGEGMAGASTAAAFLSYFVEDYKNNWMHLDLSASYQKSANGMWASGGKGHGVQTIASLLCDLG
ncbi:aminopeptidase PepB [Alginatibacterium sediminis]|uniref:Aminopeptidase PepB n=1 Tax=Alginatibacterium sediminis TaxID=2164068 RepID=A0A420E7Z3_9ALTE|nr:aminopeptidase PepB [Alginatibacterium sediminis]RKF15531.1 aminopeptidase PepB [Alginatibacterium sediminis]